MSCLTGLHLKSQYGEAEKNSRSKGMLSGFCNPFVFLGVSHVTEYWRRTDDDSWDSDGERTHENWMALSHAGEPLAPWSGSFSPRLLISCLLYTSDAADDLLCVDLGGR